MIKKCRCGHTHECSEITPLEKAVMTGRVMEFLKQELQNGSIIQFGVLEEPNAFYFKVPKDKV